MATIVAAHDLSGIGRCSLTTAISVLTAMGHHCCPLPTALLSQQTGFPGYSYVDFTPHIPDYLKGWEALEFQPDYIYTGFLGSAEQPGILAEYASRHPGGKLLADPVMGDNGKLYPCFDDSYVAHMKQLVAAAHYITPNPTEFQLLCGNPAGAALPERDEDYLEMARALQAPNMELVVITGIPVGQDNCNMVLDMRNGSAHRVLGHTTGVSFSGTGDIFASVFCGCIAYGLPFHAAVETGVDFISRAAEKMPPDCDPRHGVHYEGELHRISPARILSRKNQLTGADAE